MHHSGRTRAILRLSVGAAAILATIAALPGPRAAIRGVSYTEHHISTSSGVGLMAGIAAPRNDYAERVEIAGGRVRRGLVTGMATDVYPRGDYALGDRVNGIIIVDPASHTFSSVSSGLETPTVSGVLPSDTGAADQGAAAPSINVHTSLDTLGVGGVIDGHSMEHYRVSESYSVFQADMRKGCRSRTSPDGPVRPAGAPMLTSTTTIEYWITPAADLPALAREPLTIGEIPLSTVTVGLSLLDPVRGHELMHEVGARLRAIEAGMPAHRVALRTITISDVTIGATGERTTTTDTAEMADIQEADVDESRLVLPDGFTEVKSSARGTPTAVQSLDPSAWWRALPVARPTPPASLASLAPRVGTGRRFTISPAVGRDTTWDLDADGPLNLGSAGRWTITPRSSFIATAMAWGAGGGAARSGNGAGGGGGFSTGTISFQAGVSYIIVVGDGGKGSVEGHGDCGGDGGFGGGGAGGGVNTGGEGSPGTPFSAGGLGYLGATGNGSAGGGGGLSGLFAGATPDRSIAILIAGGGGGGTFGAIRGGAGGGDSGEAGVGIAPGRGGTQSEGGVAGADPNGAGASGGATDGSDGVGGGGGFALGRGAGGGGGGGYFGGGGGGQNRGGGGGGSGFVAAVVVRGSTVAGRGDVPGNVTDTRNGGAGVGANVHGNDGAPGRIVILPP